LSAISLRIRAIALLFSSFVVDTFRENCFFIIIPYVLERRLKSNT
jgi:hypothetical protein